MKLLIGYDGSDSSRAAIHGLHRAGLPRDAEVNVVSVADVLPQMQQSGEEAVGAPSWQNAPIVRKAQALAAEARAQALILAAEGAALVKAEFPEWKVSHEAYDGSPYWALIQASDGVSDLVIVGAQGKSGLQRFVLGSVSQNVLTNASCSVRISRPQSVPAATNTPVRIIVGVDGSPHSSAAISAVAGRAWPANTEVKVIAVVDLSYWTFVADDEDILAPARGAVEAAARELRSAGLLTGTHVEQDNPKRFLVEEAARWKADCIFLGAKGRSALERFLLGSVSGAVGARANCSVEVVRRKQ